MLINAAFLWRQETAEWDVGDLQHLKRERAVIGQDAFRQLVAANVPQDPLPSLHSGIDSTETPDSESAETP
jgi:hypothetical protein